MAVKSRKKLKKPYLRFGPGEVSGWTPVGLSGFRAMEQPAEAAIRELIQNGLDAASSAQAIPARMRFRVEEYKTKDIPGIASYRKAFREAQHSQLQLNNGVVADSADAIIADIRDCLTTPKCSVLHVLDNGIGLNKERMDALLSDGISNKDPSAAGSYGNGHVVAFPASDLRYVLYGGLYSEDETIKLTCAGHAILASRKAENGGVLSKDGYFVNDLRDDMFDRFVYAEGDDVPPLIKRQLNFIQTQWQTGSVVSIVGFNQFRREDQNLQKEIFRAAACNFFDAIYRNHLIIEFENNEDVISLDKNSLEQVLRENKEQKRSSRDFLSGKRAYEAFIALKEGNKETVETELGDVEIVVKYPAVSGQTRVDLCRNGMWITDRLPRFTNQFGNLTPFNCVIPLFENAKINRLIREAEGPLHNGVTLDLLSRDTVKRKQLIGVLAAIRAALKNIVPELDDESFRPDDIFTVNIKELAKSGGNRTTKTGTVTQVKRHRLQRSNDEEGGKDGYMERINDKGADVVPGVPRRKKAKPFNRTGNNIQFQGLVVPTGDRACRVTIVPGENTQGSEIRFALDESIDITSYGLTTDTFISIKGDTLKLNGRPAREEELRINGNGEIQGVALGKLEENQIYSIEFDYVLPKELLLGDKHEVVLKTEMIRRSPTGPETGE